MTGPIAPKPSKLLARALRKCRVALQQFQCRDVVRAAVAEDVPRGVGRADAAGTAADHHREFAFVRNASSVAARRGDRCALADHAARRLQEIERLRRRCPAVLLGRGAEVVPQADDLAGPTRRKPLKAGGVEPFAGGLRCVEHVSCVHGDRDRFVDVAAPLVEDPETLHAVAAKAHPLHLGILRRLPARCRWRSQGLRSRGNSLALVGAPFGSSRRRLAEFALAAQAHCPLHTPAGCRPSAVATSTPAAGLAASACSGGLSCRPVPSTPGQRRSAPSTATPS